MTRLLARSLGSIEEAAEATTEELFSYLQIADTILPLRELQSVQRNTGIR